MFKQEGRGEEGPCPRVLQFECGEWKNDNNNNGDVKKHGYLKCAKCSGRCHIKTLLLHCELNFCMNYFPEKSNYAAREREDVWSGGCVITVCYQVKTGN